MPKNYWIDLIKPKIKTYILEHPRATIKEIARKFDIWLTTAQTISAKIKRNMDWEYTQIVKNAKDIILKGQAKIWESMDKLDVRSYRDLHELSSVLKDMSDISQVAEETTADNMIIPVNITINYNWTSETEDTEDEQNKIDNLENDNYIEFEDYEIE